VVVFVLAKMYFDTFNWFSSYLRQFAFAKSSIFLAMEIFLN